MIRGKAEGDDAKADDDQRLPVRWSKHFGLIQTDRHDQSFESLSLRGETLGQIG